MNKRPVTAAFAGALVVAVLARWPPAPAGLGAAAFPNDAVTITHVLNRVAFGPRPGDVESVHWIGLSNYIDQQLRPERLPDTAMAGHLSNLSTLGLTSTEIADRFERPILELRRKNQQQAQASDGDGGDAKMQPPPEAKATQQQANNVVVELTEQKVLRAAYSDRQLQEVLTDFWFNHFNVDARKGRDRFLLTEYEREAIRPHVLGTFRDLLDATAKSPAMLFYLDNWMSVDPGGLHPVGAGRARGIFPQPQAPQPPNAPRGLNENYGRELMELHTLGVDGGYTQKDVTEVARAFTGWTIDRRQGGAEFRFEPRMHDEGEKVVLGHRIRAGGGMDDGERVLDILASHPATARFISTKLARRFVSDTPPAALVDRLAARFIDTKGDLREVMRTLLTSPEFLAPDAQRVKIKTPFEFVVSAVRSLDAQIDDAKPLARATAQLGMPLYQCQPPTGYKDTADAWTNTGALVSRMNLALVLGRHQLPGVSMPDGIEADQDRFVADTLGPRISDATRTTIAQAKGAPQLVALTLGSPEFQRH